MAERTVVTHWGVRRSDGTVTDCGEQSPKHSGRWLARSVLRMTRRPGLPGLPFVDEKDADPGAVLVRRSVVTIAGDWETSTDCESPEPSYVPGEPRLEESP